MAQAHVAVTNEEVLLPRADARTKVSSGATNTLGILWFIYGILRWMVAIVLAVYSSTATVMFGALLTRVPEPFTLMNVFHLMYLAVIGLAAASGLVALLAGWMLMTGAAARRVVALVAALLAVSDIPFGTTLGAYTLAVLAPRV